MLNEKDLIQLQKKGISPSQLEAQLACFAKGFPYLKLEGAAGVGKGIVATDEASRNAALQAWENYLQGQHVISKFVPASGAASRMFKDMFAFVDAAYDTPVTDFEKQFFAHLDTAAFSDDLNAACQRLHGKDIETLLAEGRHKDVARAMLCAEGLNYGQLPKGLLKFHKYADGARTPAEEHLVEGALYARRNDGSVNIHFTVSPEHRPLFEALVNRVKNKYEAMFNVRYNVSFSEQKASTDTVAANPDNTPFRNEDGSLLFRPGGHGALIVNLNDIDSDIVFVKNIDNVVPDRLKADTVVYKKVIAGMLVGLQSQAFSYLRQLEGSPTEAEMKEMLHFLESKLCCFDATARTLEGPQLKAYLQKKLNRPMRVCGMVRNVGEPGGGPFLAYNADGSVSLQILESSQIDMADPAKKAMFEQGTHFNPVDLVCALKDYRGQRFDLPRYVDPATGFISHKSKNGKELKALELPGLWNGAMSDWNTVFVEVPLSTFNPVKTVNDLYREQHQ